MIKIWNWIRNNPNRAMFLVPIILVAAISISHVVTWYDMANPINWAIYLSIAIEIAAMTALVAVDSKIKGGIWFMFGIVKCVDAILEAVVIVGIDIATVDGHQSVAAINDGFDGPAGR